jgi:hypothetical protein
MVLLSEELAKILGTVEGQGGFILYEEYHKGRITKDGNHEPELNGRINRGRAAITKLNSILWDRDVTPKTKTHIYHAVVTMFRLSSNVSCSFSIVMYNAPFQ